MNLIQKTYELLNSQNFRITFYPAENDNWMMECNGNFIGGIFDEKLCFIYTKSGSELLNNPEPVYYGFSKNAKHKMVISPFEVGNEVLKVTYKEKHDGKEFVCDISYHFNINHRYPKHIERNYELYLIFLDFCHKKKLLKYKPIDSNNRILYMNYQRNDLTEIGKVIFEELLMKWLIYTDRTNKIDNLKMLEKYYSKIEEKLNIK